MNKSLLLGFRRFLLRIPRPIWQQEVARSVRASHKSLAFMTADHHRVRDFVVRELPRIAEPIPPETIAQRLDMGLGKVISILDELEKNMTFLYRNEARRGDLGLSGHSGTNAPSHHLQQRRADLRSLRHRRDCDALRARATPKGTLTFTIQTECAHCGKEFQIEIDSRSELFGIRSGCKAANFCPHGGLQHLGRPQHYRCLLTEFHFLLVRRTCQRVSQ